MESIEEVIQNFIQLHLIMIARKQDGYIPTEYEVLAHEACCDAITTYARHIQGVITVVSDACKDESN